MDPRVFEILKACNKRPGCVRAAVDSQMHSINFRCPTDYAELLRYTDGLDGFVGENYLIMRRLGELRWYGQEDCMPLPFLLFIGSDGGGEGYAYDTRSWPPPIVNVPFIGMEDKLIRVLGHSILEFLERLARAPLFP
jgi:hypothetical protein